MTEATHHRITCSEVARVVRCAAICREHSSIEISIPHFSDSEPGQFLQLLCQDGQDAAAAIHDWPPDGFPSIAGADFSGQRPYLRRPFSIADRWMGSDGAVRLLVISRAIGVGTRWLAHLRPGDALNLTGPLGRGFSLPDPRTPVVLVGGGVGIPPLLYLARRLWERGSDDVTAVFGATTGDLLPLKLIGEPASDATATRCILLPGDAPFPALVTTDDGTMGRRGRVTDGLKAWYARRDGSKRPALVCACGPEGMLKTIAGMTRMLSLPCQLCIERNMACGVGTCLSCVVRRRDNRRPAGWSWALACADGPVFERDELLDYCGPQGA